jgi:hypothetical protein
MVPVVTLLRQLLPWMFLVGAIAQAPPDRSPRYLALQIFTGALNSENIVRSFPPPPRDLRKTVSDLRDRIGLTGSGDRRLGFVVGPLAFDNTDEEAHDLIVKAFDIALETNIAVGFHLDDSMFWERRKDLNTVDNVEWLDWNRTPNTGRRLDWSAAPKKIGPQLCVNSKGVTEAVLKRAEFLGKEISRGVKKLQAAGKNDLFLGVIAGWETQIGRDFDTGKYLGYCALTNKGFSADHPPADRDAALSEIISEFAGLWAGRLVAAGVPEGKVYSHIAFQSEMVYKMVHHADYASYLQTINWTPPSTAFCSSCVPGFSTYPQPGHLAQWWEEVKKHGNPPWASCEGTAIDPGEAERGGKGVDMEGYLGNLFNHGAQLVNVFGWGAGPVDNPFRKTAEGDNALAAYRKFLRGEQLTEAPMAEPQFPPESLPGKVHKIQDALPGYISANGPAKVAPLMEKLQGALKGRQFNEAAKVADEILSLISQ